MKTKRRLSVLNGIFVLVCTVILATSATVRADAPESSSGAFGGIYKVISSSDPVFPVTKTREYFLDFGRGIQVGRTSGSVAVSMRENPHVKVRILAWEYFPDQGRILMGNPYAEGSGNAVAIGSWRIRSTSNGAIFERGTYQVVLRRADPGDY